MRNLVYSVADLLEKSGRGGVGAAGVTLLSE